MGCRIKTLFHLVLRKSLLGLTVNSYDTRIERNGECEDEQIDKRPSKRTV